MPNSNFKGIVEGNGDYDIIADAWNSFITGLPSGVVTSSAIQQSITAPTVDVDGEAVTVTLPDFNKLGSIGYTFRYSDTFGASWFTLEENVSPNQPINPDYVSGRIFCVDAAGMTGVPTSPLP